MYRFFRACLIVLCLFFMTCCGASLHQARPVPYVLLEPRKSTTMFLQVDKSFDKEQQVMIEHAIRRIEKASGYTLTIISEWGVEEPGKFKDIYLQRTNGTVFLWNLEKNHTNFTDKQLKELNNDYGICFYDRANDSDELIIFSNEIPSYLFESVTIHEILHSENLSHNDKFYDGVMRSYASSSNTCIRTIDVQELCELYHCFGTPECQGPAYK